MKKLLMFLCFAIVFGTVFAQNQGMQRVPAQKSDKSIPLTETQKARISNLQKKAESILLKNRAQDAVCHERNLTVQEKSVIGAPSGTIKRPAHIQTKSTTVLFENFDGDTYPPTGWTNTVLNSTATWKLGNPSSGSFSAIDPTNVTSVVCPYSNTGNNQNEWLISPSITVPASAIVSFYVKFTYDFLPGGVQNPNPGATLSFKISTDNGTNWTELWNALEYLNAPTGNGVWKKIEKALSAYVGQSVKFALVITGGDGDLFCVDNFKVEVPPVNDLQLIAGFPYVQIPTSQILMPLNAQAKNIGSAAQTNVVFSAILNGTSVGSSSPIASLASNDTSAAMTITPTVNVVAGNNTLAYTISATETDETPADNTKTFVFTGSDNIYAADQVSTFSNGIGNSTAISFGNIFEITSQTILTQVAIGFGTATSLNYSISLYNVTGDLAIAATPLFTQTAVRNATGLSTVNVPATLLAPGKYFLCVNQLTATNISVSYDSVATKVLYIKNGNNLTAQPSFGAVAIRMVVASPNAPAAPTAFTATPDIDGALSCILDWTNPAVNLGGTTLSDITSIVIQRDGTTIHTITSPTPGVGATNQTWTDNTATNGLHTYAIYATNASGMGAAISQTVYVGIDPCSVAINAFPWTEGFEAGVIPDCWAQEQITGTKDWTVKTGNGAPVGILTAHTGTKNLSYYNDSYTATAVTKLILPKMDISSLTNPVLKFWHGQQEWEGDQDELKVYYKTSETDDWTLIQTYTNSIPGWTQDAILLPNKSNDYYIAFEGTGNYGKGIVIDDITVLDFTNVIDAGVVAITQPVSGANLTAAEVVTVTVKNNGSDAITSLPVKLVVNGTEVATETITASIASLSEYLYTFTATVNLSAVQVHQLKVITTLAGDTNTTNDTVIKTVENYGDIVIMGSAPTVTACNKTFVDDGVNSNYIAGRGQVQTMTVLPATAGDRAKVTFTVFNSIPWKLVMGMFEVPGDTLFVYDGSSVNPANQLAALTGDLATQMPLSFTSYATDGALTFSFHKNSGSAEAGWKATLGCVTPLANDASVTAITSPTTGGSATATVTATIKNYGGTAITSMPIAYKINNGTPVVETFSGNIAPGATTSYTFTAHADLSAHGDYGVCVYTQLTNDGDHSNDTTCITIVNRVPVKLYGYRNATQTTPAGFVSFMSNAPSVLTEENNYADGTNSIATGTYYNDSICLYSYTQTQEGFFPENYIRLTPSWTTISTTPATNWCYLMAYDYSTLTMYGLAVNFENLTSDLYKVNTVTGNMTLIGSMDIFFSAFACSANGQLYGVTNSSDFCTINKSTAAYNVIGSTGITAPEYYFQAMTFDHATGRLFWTATGNGSKQLVEINPVTGNGTVLGNMTSQMVVLYTPTNPLIGINSVTSKNANIKIYPNPATENVTIKGALGSFVKITDVSGKVIISTKIQNDEETIGVSKLVPGVYFIELQNKGTKTTSKLIKR